MPAPPTEAHFPSRLRSAAVAARVGLWLGVCFGIAFLTGLISHYAQNHSQPIPFPTSPVWGYRVTQGLHVAAGTAAVPLLLVKLWTVYPRLFIRPPREARKLAVEALERASIGVLVAGAVFQLVTGLMNSSQWYPWGFSFRTTHYAVGWVTIGAMVVHVAVKLPIIRRALTGDVEDTSQDRPTATRHGVLTRRGLLRTTWGAAGVAVLATAGSTVPFLRGVSIFGVRSGEGPAGVPINRSASAAGVTASAVSSGFRLTLAYAGTETELTRQDLLDLPQATESLPIACVEGWSASATWTGVRVRDLLDRIDAPRGRDVVVTSLQQRGAFGVTLLQSNFADDDRTLLALGLNGDTLAIDHGFPCRLIAPDRPGVLQTKWVTRLEVQA
ncbi:molybdopterin-dependent oxidoreductase [Nocardioides sp. KIGAM211]|uniref:Molybdopterin-dependent oxidoreductase n=1 Tax=Nocardioides luti TaxID=2761101 RepID=A0A7X0RJR7_9ACTN|nr:molybdopterin-dependent oxidoreductase [Nocardioides luti]MBB6629572.1 molybdopterin-dependent oxidoreductase [Nocardioides luti]